MWEASAKNPVPAGAKVMLELDSHDCFLGENVLVHFTLENAGSQPFRANFGGDYRGATRSLRFKVTATDEAGRVAEDPDASGMCFGGMVSDRELKPGKNSPNPCP